MAWLACWHGWRSWQVTLAPGWRLSWLYQAWTSDLLYMDPSTRLLGLPHSVVTGVLRSESSEQRSDTKEGMDGCAPLV